MKKWLLLASLFVCSNCFANGEVTFIKLKNKTTRIVVSSRVIMNAKQKALSAVQLGLINESLDVYLNQTHKFTDKSGERFELTFKVLAMNFKPTEKVLLSDNFIEVNQEGNDSAFPIGIRLINYHPEHDRADEVFTVGNTATISEASINGYSNTVSHETLHMFGLTDRYHNIGLAGGASYSIEDDGFDRDIMSSGKEGFSPLHTQAFVNLVKEARSQGKNKFFLNEVVNLKVGHISEKPMLFRLATEHLDEVR